MVPFRIPFGGSDSSSARGYVDAAKELLQQIPEFDHVVVAVGSGGTMAGLVRGLGPYRVLGVDCGAVEDARAVVNRILSGMAGETYPPENLRIDSDQVGLGYSSFAPSARRALSLFANRSGILLDPTYTSRAAAGLISAVKDGSIRRDARVVFWHTGGIPGLFGHPDIVKQ
jgi:D-cysteine desulfhydrase